MSPRQKRKKEREKEERRKERRKEGRMEGRKERNRLPISDVFEFIERFLFLSETLWVDW